jgi:hypothetical protein
MEWWSAEPSHFGFRPALARRDYKTTLTVFFKIKVYWMSLRKGLGQGLQRTGRMYSTAETLRAQRKTNENTLISKNYRNKFDARIKSFFTF